MIADDIRIAQNFGGGEQVENAGQRELDFEALAIEIDRQCQARLIRTITAHKIHSDSWVSIINIFVQEAALRRHEKERKG
jgi:hypothetical protein